ncbi:NACHT domain-containing protein [Actinoplanes flavus]|uniref:NACHT domain-containing protein n=1 Tax=Actinoplanes flavus TaxID=2820290 RepID=A0ABS3UZ33_9ACTN|nr:NACHT domain-containing protein [Actinoplanes flavus]MBO3743838.1 NACHT domain-containing protein [Actinoplanes flavus]
MRLDVGFTVAVVAQPAPYGHGLPRTAGRTFGSGSVRSAFDSLGRAMTLLGAPGSGKTTAMLMLLEELLALAAADAEEPIPVMLKLDTWAERRQDLASWIIREIAERHDIPARHVQSWLDDDQLVLLLDGLDEVAAEHREACIRKINEFRARHGTASVIVSCRSHVYRDLALAVRSFGTVELLPLNHHQAVRILSSDRGIPAALRADPSVWGLLDNPLMVTIAAQTFAHDPAGMVAPSGSGDTGRNRLFGAYVRTMLSRHPSPRHTPAGTLRGLAFIAHVLNTRDRTVFTTDLVDDENRDVALSVIVIRAVLCRLLVAIGLAATAIWLAGPDWAMAAAVCGLLVGAPTFLRVDGMLSDDDPLESSPQSVGEKITLLIEPLFLGPLGLPNWTKVIATALCCGGIAAALGLPDPVDALIYGASTAVAAVLTAVASASYVEPLYELQPRMRSSDFPSPTLRAILRAGVLVAVPIAAVAASVPALAVRWAGSPVDGDRLGTLVGLAALAFALFTFGGYATLGQLATRLHLRRQGDFPFPAAGLLEHAARIDILRRIGDDYQFVHRDMQDFFAGLSSHGRDGNLPGHLIPVQFVADQQKLDELSPRG